MMGIVRNGWRAALTLALLATVLVIRSGPAFADAPPPNDNFANATVITSTPFTATVDTTGATVAPDDPTGCGTPSNTVWYAITPTANETVVFDVTGGPPEAVSAYTGTEGALSQVACGQSFFGPVTWVATAGVTYHVMLSSLFGEGGGVGIQVSVALPPANDDFNHATVITAVPYTNTEDTTGATSAPDDPTGCGGTANSVWYSFTPPVAETVFASASGSNGLVTPAISAYSGVRGALTQVGCSGPFGSASWLATAGVTYHIMVVDQGPTFAGPITVQVSVALPPANDDFGNATVITSLPDNISENVAGATTAADDPTSCGGAANSVWFDFTPAVAETLIGTGGFGLPSANISVYTGSEGALDQVACASTPFGYVEFSATPGITYHIMVSVNMPGPVEGPNEQIAVSLAGVVPPANDAFGHATVVTSLPYTNSVDAEGATAAPDDPTSCGSTANSVWYELTPKVNETIVVNTDGSGYPAEVSAYTGTEGLLDQVACGESGSEFHFVAQAGVTYHLMVADGISYQPAGDLTVNIAGFVAPPNDAIANATVITALPYSTSEDTTGATTVPSDPTCIFGPSATVWYRFTPPASGTIVASAANSGYENLVSAYTGSPGALTQVACGFGSTGPFAVAQGVTYYFEVSSLYSQLGGALQFSVTATPDTPSTGPCTAVLTGQIKGGLTIGSGTACVSNATVTGVVTVGSGAQLLMVDDTIDGSVVSSGASAVAICGSSITGQLTMSSSTGFTLIGAAGAASATCGGNQIGGVDLADNNSGIDLGGNTIAGQVTVVNNRPNPATVLTAADATVQIDGNQIGRGLGCSGNTPAPVNDGLVNAVAGTGTGQCAGL